MLIFTDVSRLRKRINLPQQVISATWTVEVVGSQNGFDLGPTDTRLYAFVTLDSDSFSDLSRGNESQKSETVTLPKNVAEAILPNKLLGDLPVEENYSVTGMSYDSQYFNQSNYFGIYAIRVEDSLLVCLQTR